jgi:ribosomal protein S18 acetylase RimI-like enzyme
MNIFKLRSGRTRQDGHAETTDVLTGPALWEHDRYYKHQRHIINEVLKISEVLVASNPDDKGQVYGYVVYRDFSDEIRVISFLYVKSTFRKMGVAKSLFEKIQDAHVCTHAGPSVAKLIKKAGLIYDPVFDLKLIKEIL